MTKLFQIEERNPKDILVIDRARHDLGKIEDLAKKIQSQGQLMPILITPKGELIAGERRLNAIKKLKWKKIICRIMPGLSTEDKLMI